MIRLVLAASLFAGSPAFGQIAAEPPSLTSDLQAKLAAAGVDARRGDAQKAQGELQQARDIAHRIGDVGSEGVADLFAGVLSQSLHTPAGAEAAIVAFRSALPLLTASGNRDGQAAAAQGLGDCLQTLGRAAEARDAFRLALPLLTGSAKDTQRARTLIGLSIAERALTDPQQARADVEAALPLLKDPPARATALTQLGMICDDQADWPCGANAFLLAADAALAAPYPALAHMGLMRGALDAMRQMKDLAQANKPAEAAAQAARAAAAYRALGDWGSQVTALLAAGRYWTAAGQWERADDAEAAAAAAAKDDDTQARTLLARATTAEQRGSYRLALDWAEDALPLFAAERLAPQRALVLLVAGNAAAGVHDTPRALDYLTQAQALGAANPGVRAAAIAAEGEIRTEQSDPVRGAALSREALALHEQLGDISAANKDRSDLGLALAAGGHRTLALATYNVVLAQARAAQSVQQQAATLANIGSVYLAFGNFAQATALFRQSQEMAEQAGDRDIQATATVNLAMAQHAAGNETAAFSAVGAAIAIRRTSGDNRGEAIDMADLAGIDSETGHVQQALDLYEAVRRRFAAMADSYDEASALDGIGLVYRRLGALEEARRYFLRAAAIHESNHDEASLSVVLNNLGVVAQSLGELDDALDYYQRALAIQTALGGQVEQITLLNGIAMVHHAQGDQKAALAELTRALQLAQEVGSPETQALTLHNRGTVREEDRNGALGDLRRALPLWHKTGAAQNEASTMAVIARIEAVEGRTSAALAQVQAAIGIYETQRGEISSEDLRASWLADARGAYELRTDLLMQLDERNPGKEYALRALEAAEAGRARALLDLLREAHAEVIHHANAAQADRLRAIRSALNAKAVQAAKVDSDDPDGMALVREIDDLLAEQERIKAAIRANDPAYAALTGTAPMTAAGIQALLDPQTVLLDFAFGTKRSFLWLVTPDAVRVFQLPPRDVVQEAAAAMGTAIAGSSDPQALATLGAMLLGPVAPAIAGKRLVVVADALPQAQIPFAALPVPGASGEGGQPLVQSHELVIEPSAAALAAIRQATADRPRPSGAIAIFADPVVSSNDPRLSAPAPSLIPASGAGFDLPRLPATRSEADAILALPHAGAVLARFGFAATREAALDPALGGFKVLHFAVHGATDLRQPELSGLVLSMRGPDGAPRDGYLRLADIYGLSLPADLVVLSACGSGVGRSVSGEGITGLSRGFLYAGAASVVATLWNIEDDSTAAMMAHFYAAMWGPQHMRPSTALRAAQRAMIADGRWSAPRYWAGFTIEGEWR